MARGELMKKLLASYGRDDEFRAVAEQIIVEEEQKNNRVLARSLRQTLDGAPTRTQVPKGLAPLIPFPDAARDFVEQIEPTHTHKDIILSPPNVRVFIGLLKEFRRADEIRRKGLPVRSKLLFCGPPGCGKTLCAEIFASELGLPLLVVKLDRLISSYLGETASNVRKIFEFARKQPCVLFLDEFDALARSRDDSAEHNALRRVGRHEWHRARSRGATDGCSRRLSSCSGFRRPGCRPDIAMARRSCPPTCLGPRLFCFTLYRIEFSLRILRPIQREPIAYKPPSQISPGNRT